MHKDKMTREINKQKGKEAWTTQNGFWVEMLPINTITLSQFLVKKYWGFTSAIQL